MLDMTYLSREGARWASNEAWIWNLLSRNPSYRGRKRKNNSWVFIEILVHKFALGDKPWCTQTSTSEAISSFIWCYNRIITTTITSFWSTRVQIPPTRLNIFFLSMPYTRIIMPCEFSRHCDIYEIILNGSSLSVKKEALYATDCSQKSYNF